MIFLSFVIPTRNGMPYLMSAVDSILAIDRTDFELIVCVNDNNQDTENFLAQIKDSRIRVIRPGISLSISANYEYALSFVHGEWVQFLGSDDSVYPWFFDYLLSIIQKNGGSYSVSGGSSTNWIANAAADWSTAYGWSTGIVPTLTSSVTIKNSGPFSTGGVITIAGTAVADSVALIGSQLNVSGSLVVGHAITFTTGTTLQLNGGTVTATTISSDGSGFGGSIRGYGVINASLINSC